MAIHLLKWQIGPLVEKTGDGSRITRLPLRAIRCAG